jgi:hypothetical protein
MCKRGKESTRHLSRYKDFNFQGIDNVNIDLEGQKVTIRGIATLECVQKALQSTGKSFSPIVKG